MPEPIDIALRGKIKERLRFYEDLGLAPFYRDRAASAETSSESPEFSAAARSQSIEEPTLPKLASKLPPLTRPLIAPAQAKSFASAPAAPSLFETAEKVTNDTLLTVRQDLGDCTRCKLHHGRHTIVFGDGSPTAQLVFVGEGPGADEDAQGLPFVGRAGKLLTQMIEAMGLQRRDVYICNVVKCRPPGNRQPEKDEVDTCSPFLFRQLDVIKPKVIVCLGACAAQTLLETNRSISHYRGQWLDFRGYKMLPTYHPAYLLRNPAAKGEVWKDLQKVMAELGLEVKKSKAK